MGIGLKEIGQVAADTAVQIAIELEHDSLRRLLPGRYGSRPATAARQPA